MRASLLLDAVFVACSAAVMPHALGTNTRASISITGLVFIMGDLFVRPLCLALFPRVLGLGLLFAPG